VGTSEPCNQRVFIPALCAEQRFSCSQDCLSDLSPYGASVQTNNEAPPGEGDSSPNTPAKVSDAIGHWTTTQLTEFVRVMCLCIEAMARKGNFAYLTKHAIQQANNQERQAQRALKQHANVHGMLGCGRPLSVSFDNWWFVHMHKDGPAVFLRDSIFGHLILGPAADDGHWVVKTTANKGMFEQKWNKQPTKFLKQNFAAVQAYLLERIVEDTQADFLKNATVDDGNFNKAEPTDGIYFEQLFDVMTHDNLMRLRAHLGITEPPTKGKPGRPSQAAYRKQVRTHLSENDLWEVIHKF